MNADGLCSRRDQAADIVYDASYTAKIFDGDLDKHKSDSTYEQQFVVADRHYGRLLKILFCTVAGSELFSHRHGESARKTNTGRRLYGCDRAFSARQSDFDRMDAVRARSPRHYLGAGSGGTG